MTETRNSTDASVSRDHPDWELAAQGDEQAVKRLRAAGVVGPIYIGPSESTDALRSERSR